MDNVVREFGFRTREDFDGAFSRLLAQKGFRGDGGNVARSCLKPEGSKSFLQKTRGSRAFEPHTSRRLSDKRRGLFMEITFKQRNHARPTAEKVLVQLFSIVFPQIKTHQNDDCFVSFFAKIVIERAQASIQIVPVICCQRPGSRVNNVGSKSCWGIAFGSRAMAAESEERDKEGKPKHRRRLAQAC